MDTRLLALPLLAACASVPLDTSVMLQAPRVYVDRADEGSPIAMHGDHLVVLREGQLVSVDSTRLAPISSVAVRPWRDHAMHSDELRIHGDRVFVVSERYARGDHVVDIVLFHIDDDGVIDRVRSETIAGSRTSIPDNAAPVVIANDRLHVYLWTLDDSRFVHSVVSCNFDLACSDRTIQGEAPTGFHVSADALWVWMGGVTTRGALARVGFDATPVRTVGVEGEPVSGAAWTVRDDRLLALVRGDSSANTNPFDYSAISAELGSTMARVDVPDPKEEGILQAQLVGDAFVYGVGNGDGFVPAARRLQTATLAVHTIEGETRFLELGHTIEALAPLREDVLVAGTHGEALHLSIVDVDALGVRRHAVEPARAELFMRTRGLFVDGGRIAVPIVYGDAGRDWLGMLWLDEQLDRLGSVRMTDELPRTCRRRCGRGPSRPVFHGDRMFAMLRHELVEVEVASGTLAERQRVDLLGKF